jgi:hypothetical protein
LISVEARPVKMLDYPAAIIFQAGGSSQVERPESKRRSLWLRDGEKSSRTVAVIAGILSHTPDHPF